MIRVVAIAGKSDDADAELGSLIMEGPWTPGKPVEALIGKASIRTK